MRGGGGQSTACIIQKHLFNHQKKKRNALLTSCSANNYDFICLKAPDSSDKNRITSKGADAVSSSVSDPPDFLIPRV